MEHPSLTPRARVPRSDGFACLRESHRRTGFTSTSGVAGEGPWDMAHRERLIRARVPELIALGATLVREEHYAEVLQHVVMLDPEDNEFCVA